MIATVRRSVAVLSLLLWIVGQLQPVYAAVSSLPLPEEMLLADRTFARQGFADLALPYLEKTRYLLSLDIDFTSGHIIGHARVLFVNQTPDDLRNIVFRLYPNHPRYSVQDGVFKRRMTITGVSVGQQAAKWRVRDPWETVLDISVAVPLPPKHSTVIDIEYIVNNAPPRDILAPTEIYPLLAVYENGAWREDVATKSLDLVYSESALYAVRLRVTPHVAVYSTGVVTSSRIVADSTEYTIVTGPAREFMVVLAKGWNEIDATGGPVPIHVYYASHTEAAQQIAITAVDAMNFYDLHFGSYPYAEFDVIALPYSSGGEEYPTLVFCNVLGNSSYLRFITAHEVAHQWFYGVAGDDIIKHAWLDESLAQISGYLFYADRYGAERAEVEYWPHIMTWANRIPGTPRLVDTSLDGFKDLSEYMQTIYGAGAVFMRDLANVMGDNAFMNGLREYYQAVFFDIGTPRQFFDSMQVQTETDLAPMFCQRVGISCSERAN